VHRDLRPENILLTNDGNVKLKGFVGSNLISPHGHSTNSSGNFHYSAPEALKGRGNFGPELDVWSFGIVLYLMLYGTVPFDADSVPRLFAAITDGVVMYSKDVAPGKYCHVF